MQKQDLTIDRTKLTPEQRSQLAEFEYRKKELQALNDIADMTQEGINLLTTLTEDEASEKMGALLVDIRETLQAIKDKEDPETPDDTPVIEAVRALEKSVVAALKKIDVRPQVTIDAPPVNVSPPSVDLKGIEKALTSAMSDVSKTVNQAIAKIPTPEKEDYTPLLQAWEGISEQLLSIENATRMKPLPGDMSVHNVDGTKIYPFVPNVDFDYLGVENIDTTSDRITQKLGGASGSTVRSFVLTYASGAEKVSDSIVSLDYS